MGKWDDLGTGGDRNWIKEEIVAQTNKNIDEIGKLINQLYAAKKEGLLVILQGMDASGKDGVTKDVFSKVSPTWVDVHAFKKPSVLEMSHHFLWRIQQVLPEKGKVVIFNRSHYEDILVPSVYGYLDKKVIDVRYTQINDFEEMLEANQVHILKIYMNLSYEKQEEKLTERIEIPEKNWKHSDGDWETRERWDDFMKVYEKIFERCNKIPWRKIPCDKNWTRNYVFSELLLEKLNEINPKFPALVSSRF